MYLVSASASSVAWLTDSICQWEVRNVGSTTPPSSSQKQRDDEIVETVWDTAEHVRPWLPWCGKAIQVSAITVPVSLAGTLFTQ